MPKQLNILLISILFLFIAFACSSNKKITATANKIPVEYDSIYTKVSTLHFNISGMVQSQTAAWEENDFMLMMCIRRTIKTL
jgi:predicted protein tyrosine phosphatase